MVVILLWIMGLWTKIGIIFMDSISMLVAIGFLMRHVLELNVNVSVDEVRL
jgi:hypothetical protein